MAKPNFELIKSPYIVGNPIKSEGMFFGREEDFKIIQNWIIHNGPHVILLIGGRRSGKTSILWQILLGRMKEAGEAVLCDFHAIVPRIKKDEDFPLEIGKAILTNQLFQCFEQNFLTDDGTSWTVRLQRLIQNCLDAIQPRRLIILCDEFDALEERFMASVLSLESLLWVKHTLNQPVYFVMTGSHEFREDHIWSVFGAVSQNKPIHELTLSDALALIEKPVVNHVTYKHEVPQLIYRLSGGQPFYVQYLCHTLINHLNEQQRHYAVAKDLEEVVNFIVANPHGHIQETWRNLSHTKNVADTLAALANTISKSKEYVSTAAILKVIQQRRFKITEKTLYDTLAWLNQRTRLLEKDQQSQSYRFRIDLIRHWIAYNFQTGEDIELLESHTENMVMDEGYGPTPTVILNKEEEYAARLEKILLKTGFLTVKERLALDNFVAEYELDRDQADLLENRVREKFSLQPINWIQEYKDSCFYLKNIYPHTVPKNELNSLNVYISWDRLSSEKAREISKYMGLKPATRKMSLWLGMSAVVILVVVTGILSFLLKTKIPTATTETEAIAPSETTSVAPPSRGQTGEKVSVGTKIADGEIIQDKPVEKESPKTESASVPDKKEVADHQATEESVKEISNLPGEKPETPKTEGEKSTSVPDQKQEEVAVAEEGKVVKAESARVDSAKLEEESVKEISNLPGEKPGTPKIASEKSTSVPDQKQEEVAVAEEGKVVKAESARVDSAKLEKEQLVACESLANNAVLVLKTAGLNYAYATTNKKLIDKIKNMNISGRTAHIQTVQQKYENYLNGFDKNFANYMQTVQTLGQYSPKLLETAIANIQKSNAADTVTLEFLKLFKEHVTQATNHVVEESKWKQEVQTLSLKKGVFLTK